MNVIYKIIYIICSTTRIRNKKSTNILINYGTIIIFSSSISTTIYPPHKDLMFKTKCCIQLCI